MNAWIKTLPHSRMEYPSEVLDRVKYWFWRVYTPLHPSIRHFFQALGISAGFFVDSVDHSGRQDYLVGMLHPGRSLYEFVTFLVTQGFGNHFVAWRDPGEAVSLRKTVGFRYQYHIRVFHDGEVRCHYEYTPEYRPLQHLLEIGFENRTEEFKNLVAGWVVPTTL